MSCQCAPQCHLTLHKLRACRSHSFTPSTYEWSRCPMHRFVTRLLLHSILWAMMMMKMFLYTHVRSASSYLLAQVLVLPLGRSGDVAGLLGEILVVHIVMLICCIFCPSHQTYFSQNLSNQGTMSEIRTFLQKELRSLAHMSKKCLFLAPKRLRYSFQSRFRTY